MIQRLYNRFNLSNSNQSLLLLLTLLSCALLIDVSVAKWVIMPPSIMVMSILLCTLYINYRYWWASIGTIILFILMLGPDFPRLANHGNLALFICLAIIVVYLRKVLTAKTIHPDTISQCFQFSLIGIYFIAGFHKLNSGFFSITGTCSTYVTQGLNLFWFNKFVEYPNYIVRILQYGTIVMEMVVPFGILFHRTRFYTAWILIIFHIYLSFCGFSNFSAFALFVIAGSVINLRNTKLSDHVKKSLRVYVFIIIISSLTAFFFKRLHLSTRQTMLMVNGVILNIGIMYFCFKAFKKSDLTTWKSVKPISALPVLCTVFICVWGLQGYFGLSNTSTLTMFSNLVTEQSRSNHYLINTSKTKLWNFEEDYITVLKLPKNSKWGKYYKIENYDLPVIEFKKIAAIWVEEAKGDKIECTILYKGQIIKIKDLAHSKYSKPLWWHIFLYYRRIPKAGVNQCQW